MAGSEEQSPALSTRDLVNMIKAVGKQPLERDTLYNVVHDFTNETFEEDEIIKGYISLPVINA
jgi:aminodeoxyfutalosine synthase